MACFSDQCSINFLQEEPIIPKSQPNLAGEGDTLNDVKFPKFQQVTLNFSHEILIFIFHEEFKNV